jgi:hypothetical protein
MVQFFNNLSLCFLLVIGPLLSVMAHDRKDGEHHYHAHDRVAVVANTVGPYNNPTETYPVCSPMLILRF